MKALPLLAFTHDDEEGHNNIDDEGKKGHIMYCYGGISCDLRARN